MSLFTLLLLKLIPLYTFVLLGYIAARYLMVQKESIATLLIYIISPIVVFHGVAIAPETIASVTLPIVAYCIGSILCLMFYVINAKVWRYASVKESNKYLVGDRDVEQNRAGISGSEKNILAFSAGAGNVGYFGLPVIITLFGETAFSYAVLFIFGLVLYECTLGFYITAKGNYSTRESLMKVVRLPTIYAFIIGVIINVLDINIGGAVQEAILSVRGAYSVLGMMLVGAGLASITIWKIDYRFTGMAFLAKFIAYPAIMIGVILLDIHVWHIYSLPIYQVLILLSIVPLASNTVAFAVKLKVHPEKMAMAVFLSTILAVIYIPIMVMLVQKWMQIL